MKFNTAAICLSNTSSFCRFSLGPREGNKQQKGKFEDRTINFKGIEEKFTYRHLNNMWIKYNMHLLHSLENLTWLHLMKTKNVGKFQSYERTRWRDLKVPSQPLQFQGWSVYYFSLLFQHIVKLWKILQVNTWTNILILRARILEMGRRREEKWQFQLKIETPQYM